MSYYSRKTEVESRSRERDNHYKRNSRGRDRSWNREKEKERPRSSFRGRDVGYSDRGDHHRYRPPSRDEKIVLVRRDRERDEDKKQRTPKESFKHKESKPTHHVSTVLRSPIPVPEKTKDHRSKHKDDHRQRENGRLPDSATQSDGSATRSHTNHVVSKSNVSVKEEIVHPITPYVRFDKKEALPKSSVPVNQIIKNSAKTHPVVNRKESGSQFTIPVNQGRYNHNQTSVSSTVEKEDKELNPVQKELVEKCFSNCKIRGDYDKIRRECMLDIDTKPAFINARAKVKDITEKFLQKARYHPHMDKAKLRENLKKSFELSNSFEAGLESLVNQILLPKISNVVRPIIEAEVHRCLGITVPADNNGSKGSDEQQSQAINGCTNKDYQKPTGEITQATTSTHSCLPPMNVIMDAEPASTSSKKAKDHQLLDSIDKQLHDDIQEELNEEKNESLQHRFEVKFPREKVKETAQTRMDDHDEDMEMQEIGDVDNAKGNVEPENHSNELSNRNVELEFTENANECITVNTETGVTQDERFEGSVGNEVGMQVETNELVVKEIRHSVSPTKYETVKNSDDDMEEDSDDESPEFEKIGEVSPVRIDSIPDFEIPSCDTLVPQPMEQLSPNNENVVEHECTNNNVEAVKKSECVSTPVENDQVLRIS